MIDPCKPDYSNTPASCGRPRYSFSCGNAEAVPAISIVTPFFNAGEVFHQTAESVFGQSFQQWEWLIVDDGSDEPESAAILESYARSDSRVRVIRSAVRSGPAAARNLGVAQARASYVAFIDSDDLYEPTALEKWLWFLESHPHFAVASGFHVGFGAKEYLWREGFHSGPVILERNLIQITALIRRDVYIAAGGMDETILGGMEDWDFWLKCANAGFWGGTVPEFLDWYRRRPSHNDRWRTWDGGERQTSFHEQLKLRYPRLFAGTFPSPAGAWQAQYAELPALPWFANRLGRKAGTRRLLILVPHLTIGGADKYVLDLMAELIAKHGYEITIATTRNSDHPWRHCFEALTPDVFTLDTLLPLPDYPRFLAYLIRSRGIDSVLVTHSELGYRLLPYLRAQCPEIRCYDYVHAEEPKWKSGGYPALSVAYSPFLNRTAASSRHLKEWMTARGGDVQRISVVTTNIDVEAWRRDRYDPAALRKTWDVPGDIPVILFAGRLAPQKQPEVLARTLKNLHERGLRFLCLIAGDGECGAWLRDFVRDGAISGARLLGYCTNEEIRELLAVSDLFFLPSRYEGIALTLFEAMAMEVVPVGADVGGQTELVAPDCGVLIATGGDEPRHYADVIERLLGDPAARGAMAAAARRRVSDCFRLDQMGQEMAALLRGDRDGGEVFDLRAASQAYACTHAREIIEQCRFESLADALWAEREKQSGATLAEPTVPPPSQAVRARSGGLAALAMLLPLFGGRLHRRNRQLLFGILRHASSRRELLAALDGKSYAAMHPDVPPVAPLPLLHYVFYGYREGRRLSPNSDGEAPLRPHPEVLPPDINPLLWKIHNAQPVARE